MLCTSSLLAADAVYLKDGRVYHGTIVESSRKNVVIETVISNIATTLTLTRREIDRIETGVEPPERATHKPPAANERSRPTADTKRTLRIGTIRVNGRIGYTSGGDNWISAPSLLTAMQFAYNAKVDRLIFVIDTPGGAVNVAEDIAEIILLFGDIIPTSALIDRSISAGIWLSLACDTIYVAESADAGAATPYTITFDGQTQTTAKSQAHHASKVAAIAEAGSGVPAEVVRAMIQTDKWLLARRTDTGEAEFSDQPTLRGTDGWVVLDDDSTILAMTGREMLEWGIAAAEHSELDALTTALGEGYDLVTVLDFTGRVGQHTRQVESSAKSLAASKEEVVPDLRDAREAHSRAKGYAPRFADMTELERKIDAAKSSLRHYDRAIVHLKNARRAAFDLMKLAEVEYHYRGLAKDVRTDRTGASAKVISARSEAIYRAAEAEHSRLEKQLTTVRKEQDDAHNTFERLKSYRSKPYR